MTKYRPNSILSATTIFISMLLHSFHNFGILANSSQRKKSRAFGESPENSLTNFHFGESYGVVSNPLDTGYFAKEKRKKRSPTSHPTYFPTQSPSYKPTTIPSESISFALSAGKFASVASPNTWKEMVTPTESNS